MASPVPPNTLRRSNYAVSGQVMMAVIFAVIVVAALYFARAILMPFALAVLLSFVLAPLVRRLQRLYFPRGLAVTSVVLIAFGIIFMIGSVMLSQVNQLASDLPRYQSTLREKIQVLRGAGSSGTLERATEVLQELNTELNKPEAQQGQSAQPGAPGQQRPIPVQVQEPDPGPLRTLLTLITPLVDPLATTGIVIIFVIFILWHRQDLRNRLVRLAGSNDLQRTTNALNDAGKRLSRLFLTQLALNATFGLIVGVGWWIIGVPSAALWGILVMILRFLPYIGTWISAIFPLLLAAAIGPDWSMVIYAGILFLIVDIFIGQVVEPTMQGHSTGLSPVAVVASAAFWTWLWGPIGLILATPITLCLVVLGRHIEQLKFLDVMFGDEPALSPPELAYQRMLARDPVEVTEEARLYLKTNPVLAYYQNILLGGLRLAQNDADRGMLDEQGRKDIRDVTEDVVDDLRDHTDPPEILEAEEDADAKPLAQLSKTEAKQSDFTDDLPSRWKAEAAVLCIPGESELDEALAMIAAQLVTRRGFGAKAEKAGALSMARIFGLDCDKALLVCLTYLQSAKPAQIRYALRRLRRKVPDAHIVIALMGENITFDKQEALAEAPKVYFVEGSLEDLVERIVAIARADESETEQEPPQLKAAARERVG